MIGFFLTTPKAVCSSIKVFIYHKGVRYSRALGRSVPVLKWDKKRQLVVVRDFSEAGAINVEIHNLRLAAERLLKNDPEIVSNKHFWSLVDCELNGGEYNSVDPRPKTFVDYVTEVYIPRFEPRKLGLRINRFKAVVELLKRFESVQGRVYGFADVNTAFYRDFEVYFVAQKYSQNYFGSIVKVVKQIMREAIDVDRLHDNNEFRSANFKSVSVEIDNVYLTDEELQRIHTLVIDDQFVHAFYPKSECLGLEERKKSYTLAKNLFLIGAYTGLRVSDFTQLLAENFSNDKITKVTAKTGARVVIPIHPVVRDIVDGGFDFTESLSEQKVRAYIKDICKMAGITDTVEVRRSSMGKVVVESRPKYELVSTHTARRSFATNAYKAGVPTLSIMKIIGHTKESTFMKYIKISQEENADLLATHPFFMG